MGKNFVDKIVEFVAPKRALQRYQSRAVLEVVAARYDDMVKVQQRKYDGTASGRHYSDWKSANVSVNQEVQYALRTLRERSRDLCRNNAYAINALRTLRNNVIGTGIIPNPTGEGVGKNQLRELKRTWKKWADKTICDYDENNTFSGLQSLVASVVFESGECFVRRVRGASDDYLPLRLQILEGDFLDGSHHTGTWSTTDTIEYYGIRFDKKGKRLGYWLYKQHPSEFGGESEFVEADDIIHIYEVERPGQIRGVPGSTRVMLRLRDLDDYEYTERIRSKVAAAFAIFITDPIGSDTPRGSSNQDELERIEPGMIKTLLPGQTIFSAQPPTTQGFGDFVKGNLRGVSAGVGISYEALTNDYSNVNFSSGRMGWIEFNRNVEHLQWNVFIPRLCDKVFSWFVQACQLKGVIPWTAKIDCSWTPPRREMIDPYKEIQALKEQIRAGLISWQDVVRTFGYVPEDLLEELKKDKDMWDKVGLMPTADPRFDSNRPPDQSHSDPLIDEKD